MMVKIRQLRGKHESMGQVNDPDLSKELLNEIIALSNTEKYKGVPIVFIRYVHISSNDEVLIDLTELDYAENIFSARHCHLKGGSDTKTIQSV